MARQTILVADDEAAHRELVKGILEDEGYGVRCAENGREALALIRKERPGLILLDLLMPVMSGYEFLRHLWADPELENIPTVVVSAAHEPHRAGTVGFLPKPIQVADLLAMVGRMSRANLTYGSGEHEHLMGRTAAR